MQWTQRNKTSGRTWLRSIVFALVTFLAASSVGAEPYRPKIAPECKVYPLADGREVCGYIVKQADGTETMDEWQAVLRVDAELVVRRKSAELQAEREVELQGQIGDLRGALEACGTGTAALKDRNAVLTTQLIDRDRLYQNERVKPRFSLGGGWAWGTAAVLAAALIGFVGKELVD